MSCFGFSGTIFWQYQWYIYVKGFNLSLSKDLQSARMEKVIMLADNKLEELK